MSEIANTFNYINTHYEELKDKCKNDGERNELNKLFNILESSYFNQIKVILTSDNETVNKLIVQLKDLNDKIKNDLKNIKKTVDVIHYITEVLKILGAIVAIAAAA